MGNSSRGLGDWSARTIAAHLGQSRLSGTVYTGYAMRILQRLDPAHPCFSFEFFPPKTDEGTANLLRTLEELAPLEPGFVSVTYGAGGSTRDRTLELVERIKSTTGIEAMAHLTCVGHTREEL